MEIFTKTNVFNFDYPSDFMVEELEIILEKTINGYNNADCVDDLKTSIRIINRLIALFKTI